MPNSLHRLSLATLLAAAGYLPGTARAQTPDAAGDAPAAAVEPAGDATPAPTHGSPATRSTSTSGNGRGETTQAPGSAPGTAESELVPPGERARMKPRAVGKVQIAPGKGLVAESEDGEFSFGAGARVQFRYERLHLGAPEPGDRPNSHSLAIRRARVGLRGHFLGADNRYKVELAVAPGEVGTRGGTLTTSPLLEAYVDFTHLRDASVRVGQYKVPFNRQQVMSDGDLQLVDRSIVDGEFALERDVALDVRSLDLAALGVLRYYASVGMGEGRNAVGASDFGMQYLLRVEAVPLGDFDDYGETDFERRAAPRVGVGLVGGLANRASRTGGSTGPAPADGGTTNLTLLAADAIFKMAGATAFAEFALRSGERDPGSALDAAGNPVPAELARNGWGLMLQAGYLVPKIPFDVAARWAIVRPLGDETSLSRRNELAGGVGWYFARHALKLQADYARLWADDAGLGDDRVRVQLQAAF